MHTFPSRKQLQTELSVFIKPDTAKGVALFVSDYLIYAFAIALVLASNGWVLKLVGGIIAGIKIANLTTLAHDAAHNSLTRSRTVNKYIAILGFTPALFNYALWLYDHHFLHHRRTNQDHPDSYVPLSRQEYDSLTPFQKFKYRLYRAPSICFFGLYYIVERWWHAKLFPRRHMPPRVQRDGWRQFAWLMVYLALFLALLILAPLYSSSGSIEAVVFGFVVPFYIFQSLYSFTVFVQHNHYRIPWFKGKRPQEGDGQQAYITATLVFPKWFTILAHNIYDHGAHHIHPAIPCYQLPAAQARLEELIGERAIVSRFSFGWLYDMMRRCKLYDYERHYWIDYEGNQTTRTTLASQTNDSEFQYYGPERRLDLMPTT